MSSFQMVSFKPDSALKEDEVVLSEKVRKDLGIIDQGRVKLRVGRNTTVFNTIRIDRDENTARLSLRPTLLKKLHLNSSKLYGINYREGEIAIGPVVGIMIRLYASKSKPFGPQTFFFKQLMDAANQLGQICFAFAPTNIIWNRKAVYGYTYRNDQWVRDYFPIPDVVYPRLQKYDLGIRKLRQKLEKMGVVFFSPFVIGKWEVHRIISQSPLKNYVPDTRLIKNLSQVEPMIKKYRVLYLKPVHGSQGRNIIRVAKKNNSSSYQYQYQLNNKLYRGTAAGLVNLRRALRPVMGKRAYLMQNRIDLLNYEGSVMDVRIVAQKDHTGRWGVTGMAYRIGRPGNITSNISAGGAAKNVLVMLEKFFPDKQERMRIVEEIKDLSVKAAQTLEEKIGPTGEMGIDIGVDKDGKVWFIEANLRPARQVFTLMGDTATRLKSVENPMLYCRYLAGFR
ncbi:MAG: YheC/YheD family protein [Syntrophomonadaceae bacterium]|jgi:hypothetical protein